MAEAPKPPPPKRKEAEAEPAENISEKDLPADVSILSGGILTIKEATEVLRGAKTHVVAVIGPSESGKTTFSLSIYDAFQLCPFGRWNFAGSLTIPAFEERCHLARAESGRSRADTPRTLLPEGLGFLHIAVSSSETGPINLLFSDRAGEAYLQVANGVEDCDSLPEVPRADHVLFLLDGEKLSGDERHGVKNDLRMIIATLIEGGVLGRSQQVTILLTKYDLVKGSKVADRADKEFEEFVEEIRRDYGASLATIVALKIAARSENETVQDRYGILEALERCLQVADHFVYMPQAVKLPNRAFLHFPAEEGKGE